MNLNQAWLSRLTTRWDIRSALKKIHQFKDAMDKLTADFSQHDLKQLSKDDEHLIKLAKEVVPLLQNVAVETFLWMEAPLKVMPDTHLYAEILDQLHRETKKIRGKIDHKGITKLNEDLISSIENAKKTLVHGRTELLKEAQADLGNIYTYLLNLIKAAEKAAAEEGDRESFMNGMITFWKNEGTSWLNYLSMRAEIRAEIKDYVRVKKHRNELAPILVKLEDVIKKKGGLFTAEDVRALVDKSNEKTRLIYQEVRDAFKEGGKANIRTCIILFTMVSYMYHISRKHQELAQKHDIPLAMAEGIMKEIKDVAAKVKEDGKYDVSAL